MTKGAMIITPTIRINPCTSVVQATAYNPPITVYAVTIAAPSKRAIQCGIPKSHINTMLIAVYCPAR